MYEVKYLSNNEIKNITLAVLEEAKKLGFYDFNSYTPVDLIVEKIMGFNIRFESLEKEVKEGVIGAIDLKNKVVRIDHSLDDTEMYQEFVVGRYRFTAGHEIGHNYLHKSYFNESNPLAFYDETDSLAGILERQADKFSAYLLMPTKLVKKEWQEMNNCEIEQCIFRSLHERIVDMKDFFKVSRQAMDIRLQELDLIEIH